MIRTLRSSCPAARWRSCAGIRAVEAALAPAVLVSLLLASQPLPLRSAVPEESATGEVEYRECDRCDERGRQVCPDCDGRGKLFRACERCGGTGRRPCPTCAGEDGDDASPPGRVRCTLCRGAGTLGDDQRLCSKCLGAGTLACEICSGTGTVRCVTEQFERICPRCRLTGRIECLLCGGTRRVAVKPTDGSEVADEAEGEQESEDAGDDAPASREEIAARFEELRRRNEQGVAWIESAPRDALSRLEDESRTLLRKIERRPTSPELAELDRELSELRKKSQRLGIEWTEIAGVLASFARDFERCRTHWESGTELPDAPGSRSEERAYARWERDMRLVLRLAEKRARRLQTIDPASALAAVDGLVARGTELATRAETALAKPAVSADSENPSEDDGATSRGGNESGTGTGVEGAAVELVPTSPGNSPARSADDEASRHSEESGSAWAVVLLGIVLVLAATGGLVFWRRTRSRRDEIELW